MYLIHFNFVDFADFAEVCGDTSSPSNIVGKSTRMQTMLNRVVVTPFQIVYVGTDLSCKQFQVAFKLRLHSSFHNQFQNRVGVEPKYLV